MPAVMVSSTCLILDRLLSTHFFNQAEGGDPLLWQHLFWFFGHPEVYIIFVPALGMMSEIVGTFSRRPVFGYLGHGAVDGLDGIHRLRRLGAPHVRDRPAAAGAELLHRGEHDDRRADVAADLRLDCDGLDGAAARDHGAISLRGVVLLRLRHRRPHGRDARVRAARSPGARHLLRRRAPALRADRRVARSRCSGPSSTGSRR